MNPAGNNEFSLLLATMKQNLASFSTTMVSPTETTIVFNLKKVVANDPSLSIVSTCQPELHWVLDPQGGLLSFKCLQRGPRS